MDIIDAFLQEDEILFTLPGVLKDTVGPFKRGDLSAVIAPPKGKKSFLLLFIAEQALWAGLRVAFFSLEMRKPQIIRRAWQAWNGQPINKGYVMIPRFELISGGGQPGDELYAVENDKKLKDGIDLSNVDELQDRIRKRFGGGDIRFVALPAFSATIDDIVAHIDNLTWYDNFAPDLVLIDYADIVKPSKSAGTEYRHQLDSIWKGLRALAQSRNIHVCTASQTNRAGMRGDVELEHVAEDMRKLAHVSLLLAINSKPEEREINVLRVKTLLNRDDSVVDGNEAVVLNQFAIGKFYLDSKLRKNVEKTDIVD
jgi:replicative DNA helicase